MPTSSTCDPEPVSAADANRSFSKLLRGVRAGRSYVITSHGAPVAQLTPFDAEVVSAEKIEARRALLTRLATQPVQNAPKYAREELYDEMLSEPFLR